MSEHIKAGLVSVAVGSFLVGVILLVSYFIGAPKIETEADVVPIIEYCLPEATIAFDSVVNRNLGMHPEDQIHFFGDDFSGSVRFGKVVLGAYLWTDDPHSYAHEAFVRCILAYKY
jgi:hypothetical protein